ncbi:hypothetical protein ACWGQ5_45225, partial [Streptomyces sp. NPDC055722]
MNVWAASSTSTNTPRDLGGRGFRQGQGPHALTSLDGTGAAGIRYLIRDSAGYFTEGFDAVFTA